MRWVEPLAFALLAPVFQFISFGDLFELGQWQYHEWTMVLSPVSYVVAAAASLLVWGVVAALARFLPPRGKSASAARWLRILGVLVVWVAVFAWMTFGDATFTRAEEMRSFQWALVKIALGVVAAIVALLAGGGRAAART